MEKQQQQQQQPKFLFFWRTDGRTYERRKKEAEAERVAGRKFNGTAALLILLLACQNSFFQQPWKGFKLDGADGLYLYSSSFSFRATTYYFSFFLYSSFIFFFFFFFFLVMVLVVLVVCPDYVIIQAMQRFFFFLFLLRYQTRPNIKLKKKKRKPKKIYFNISSSPKTFKFFLCVFSNTAVAAILVGCCCNRVSSAAGPQNVFYGICL